MGSKIVGNVLFAFVHAAFLIATYLREHLHATEHHRRAIDKRCGPLEGIRRATVDPKGRILGVEPLSQP